MNSGEMISAVIHVPRHLLTEKEERLSKSAKAVGRSYATTRSSARRGVAQNTGITPSLHPGKQERLVDREMAHPPQSIAIYGKSVESLAGSADGRNDIK